MSTHQDSKQEFEQPPAGLNKNLTPNAPPIRYHNEIMSFSVLLIKIVEYMFVAGWAGTAVVLLLTFVEDVGTLLDRKDENSR